LQRLGLDGAELRQVVHDVLSQQGEHDGDA
jgi:hypothetical protein